MIADVEQRRGGRRIAGSRFSRADNCRAASATVGAHSLADLTDAPRVGRSAAAGSTCGSHLRAWRSVGCEATPTPSSAQARPIGTREFKRNANRTAAALLCSLG